jgi:hypothetical protein
VRKKDMLCGRIVAWGRWSVKTADHGTIQDQRRLKMRRLEGVQSQVPRF